MLFYNNPKKIYLGLLIYRYKRFLAKMKIIGEYKNNQFILFKQSYYDIVYVANPGYMRDICIHGSFCLLKEYFGKYKLKWFAIESEKSKFKYDDDLLNKIPYDNVDHKKYLYKREEKNKTRLKINENKIPNEEIIWVGIDTMTPNKLIYKHLQKLYETNDIKKEVKIGNSRIDFKYQDIFIEVKNVHWNHNDYATFPDCVTTRGTKQLKTLKELNCNIDLHYFVQRHDLQDFTIAKNIDINYYNQIQLMNNLIKNKYVWFFRVYPNKIILYDMKKIK